MPNSLSPAFIRIEYASQYGAHSMTVPSVPVLADMTAPSGFKFDLRGAAASVDVGTAVLDYIAQLRPFYKAHVNFIAWTMFTKADPAADSLPEASGAINLTGTSVVAGHDQATQITWTWRTDRFGIFKLVMLDANSGNFFGKTTTLVPSSADESLSNYVTADVTWIAGRDGGRPKVFLQASRTLNEKLRRSYRLT